MGTFRKAFCLYNYVKYTQYGHMKGFRRLSHIHSVLKRLTPTPPQIDGHLAHS